MSDTVQYNRGGANSGVAVTYHDFDNQGHRQNAEQAIHSALCLAPWWLKRIEVYESTGEEANAQVFCQQEYRQVVIKLFPFFHGMEEARQRQIMAHEIIHAILAPLVDFVDDELVEPLEHDNPRLHKTISDELDRRLESVVQDLAITFAGEQE